MKKLKYVIPLVIGLLVPFYIQRLWDNFAWVGDDGGRAFMTLMVLSFSAAAVIMIVAHENDI